MVEGSVRKADSRLGSIVSPARVGRGNGAENRGDFQGAGGQSGVPEDSASVSRISGRAPRVESSVLASRVRLGVQVRLDILQSTSPMGPGIRLCLALHCIGVVWLPLGRCA